MKISGFTIVKNARKFNYPVLESIRSVLPACDEFIVNVGDSDDDTLSLIQSLPDPKIRIIRSQWKMDQKPDVLSYQTNLALKECAGDWAFYLQSDEVIHEDDLPRLLRLMTDLLKDSSVDGLRLRWLHFYGSYCRYRIDQGWFQKQCRIIRNNGGIESCKDAWTFERKDKRPMKVINSGSLLYHYGWVQPGEVMGQRRQNARLLWNQELTDRDRAAVYEYGDLNRFPIYYGSHPEVMNELVAAHVLSGDDWNEIRQRFWWHPFLYLRPRRKTWRRVKEKIY